MVSISLRFKRKLTIQYSTNEEYYYVVELVCMRCDWIGTKKVTEEPELVKRQKLGLSPLGLDALRGYIQYDNKYYREILPFAFWKVKNGKKVKVKKDNELVKDYVTCGHGH